MNFIKKNIKLILGIVIGAVLISGISVYATSTYYASQVTYKEGKTVEQALNELYETKNYNYIIKDGKLNSNVANLGVYSDGGYSCSVDYSKNDFIQINQSGGTEMHAWNPYWDLIIDSNNISEYRKLYIDFSYDYTSTYKGLAVNLNLLDRNGNSLSNETIDVSGYWISTDRKFDRKTVAIDIDENTATIIDLKLKSYTCDNGTSTACIYNLWFE